MFESGEFVADHVEPIVDAQIQPNGVDLTLAAVFEQVEPGRLGTDDKTIGDRLERDPSVEPAVDDRYDLPPGGYVIRYAETVQIPEGHVGFVLPRSSLMRNSCMLNTAVWDAGYRGRGEGLLQVHHRVVLEPGTRIAQLVLAKADHTGTYAGSYQGENLQ